MGCMMRATLPTTSNSNSRSIFRSLWNTKMFGLLLGLVAFHLLMSSPLRTPRQTPASAPAPSGVAMCTIQKSALQYLDEFVDYHISLGVEQIYLYDNSDDYEALAWYDSLEDQTTRAHITLKHFPGEAQMMPAYRDCAERIKKEKRYEWIAILDTDELIVLKKHDHIMDLLDTVNSVAGGLSLNWYVFGYSGELQYRKVPMSKRFQMRHPGTDRHVKTISRASTLHHIDNPHFGIYRKRSCRWRIFGCREDEVLAVDTYGNFLKGMFDSIHHPYSKAWHEGGPDDVAVVHHYKEKSLEEYMSRCARGRAAKTREQEEAEVRPYCMDKTTILNEYFNADNVVFDDSAWQFLKNKLPDKYSKYDE